ncbi:DUF1823 family protein [Gloeobacter kilaueensis]|uniref:DUF1823 domain-containing protein n=1 Tax=Gloeobacter kilaueensis (strain ATCC BAA-2537 / CCAP 1431/1 / ULC 316 / JS1) TaxID=1183438 RepID=U5QI94_GLOK1|nr:DUF1823 family protein [Gloeobacter kilaueensis]AGY58661.1 hypothetical protein GKIL_2415 [Gloeobacter kilaueensis JS1]
MSALPPLSEATFWEILGEQIPDETVNALVWHYLGYRQNSDGSWDNSGVDSTWQQEYPEPPDFIASRPATIKLTRSIDPADKQLLKEHLGFGGYQVSELTPRRTRRATAVNWLLAYLRHHPQ